MGLLLPLHVKPAIWVHRQSAGNLVTPILPSAVFDSKGTSYPTDCVARRIVGIGRD